MYLYLNSLGAVVRALCAFLSCSLLTTTVFTHVFIEQIKDDDIAGRFTIETLAIIIRSGVGPEYWAKDL